MAKRTKPAPAVKREADPKRIAAFEHGISAENRAAAYLLAKGYRIHARRFRSPAGEIDIVATRRGTLVFVEVKARAKYGGRILDSPAAAGRAGRRPIRRCAGDARPHSAASAGRF
ncbi:MAG: YraN family protein [Xanthobacteraceae bacterium]